MEVCNVLPLTPPRPPPPFNLNLIVVVLLLLHQFGLNPEGRAGAIRHERLGSDQNKHSEGRPSNLGQRVEPRNARYEGGGRGKDLSQERDLHAENTMKEFLRGRMQT